MKFEKQNQYGRSMIEMLGVLAIIGVLSVGGIAGFSKAMAKYRINKTIDQITMIATNVRTLYGSQKDYDGLNSWNSAGRDVIQRSKIVPEEMMTLDNDGKLSGLVNAYAGRVEVCYASKATANDKKAFYIDFEYPTVDVCIDLLTHEWNNVGMNAFLVMGGPGYYEYFASPMTVATASEACSEAATKASADNYPLYLEFFFDVNVHSPYWQSQLQH